MEGQIIRKHLKEKKSSIGIDAFQIDRFGKKKCINMFWKTSKSYPQKDQNNLFNALYNIVSIRPVMAIDNTTEFHREFDRPFVS